MLPQLKQADVRGSGTPYRVFISYSRLDAALAKEFLKHLKASARTVGSPFKPEEIFFDQTEIMAGDDWERVIQPALDASHTVILLVSVNALDPDRYCWGHEIPRAAAARKLIIPVLLSECPWSGTPIPGDPGQRVLSDLSALPRVESGNGSVLMPVDQDTKSEQERARRWVSCVEAIAKRIQKQTVEGNTRTAGVPSVAGGADGSHKPARKPMPRLPILCDQAPARDTLRKSLGPEVVQKPLFVLVQGGEDDHPLDFWKRVTDHELPRLDARLSAPLAEAHRSHDLTRVPARSGLKSFFGKLGSVLQRDTQKAVSGIQPHDQILRDLWSTLNHHADSDGRDPSGGSNQTTAATSYDRRLKALLDQQDRIQPVHCLLSSLSPEEAVASVGALARTLSHLGRMAPVHRLAFGFIWQRPEDLAAEFSEAVCGDPHSICQVITLPRLEPFGRTEVQDWFQTHELHRSLSETRFLDHAVPKNTPQIRFRDLFHAWETFPND